MGRLALLSYYEVRRWARMAGEVGLAEHSSVLLTERPHLDRDSFLAQIDNLIAELEQLLNGQGGPISSDPEQFVQPVRDRGRAAR